MRYLIILQIAALVTFGCGAKKTAPNTPQFRPPLEAACESGEAQTCIKLAQTAEQKGDFQQAIKLFSRACELSSSEGCLFAAGALLEDDPDTVGALKFLAKACTMREPAACYGAGVVHSGGYRTPADPLAAIPMFDKACDLGLAEGCGSAAILKIELAADELTLEKAVEIARDVCARGDASTCFALGQREAQSKNHTVAANLFSDACRLGDGVACRATGLMFVDGRGVPKDPVRASMMFEKGCVADIGDVTSCAYYGYARYQNAETDEERSVAKSILLDACNAPDAEACFRMALVEPGNVAWVDKACSLSPDSCDRYRQVAQPKTK